MEGVTLVALAVSDCVAHCKITMWCVLIRRCSALFVIFNELTRSAYFSMKWRWGYSCITGRNMVLICARCRFISLIFLFCIVFLLCLSSTGNYHPWVSSAGIIILYLINSWEVVPSLEDVFFSFVSTCLASLNLCRTWILHTWLRVESLFFSLALYQNAVFFLEKFIDVHYDNTINMYTCKICAKIWPHLTLSERKLNIWIVNSILFTTHALPICFLGAEHLWSYFCINVFKCRLYSMVNIREFCFFKSQPFGVWNECRGKRMEVTHKSISLWRLPLFVDLMLHDSPTFLSDLNFCLSSYKPNILISWPSSLCHSGALQALSSFAGNIFNISFMAPHLSWKPEMLQTIELITPIIVVVNIELRLVLQF